MPFFSRCFPFQLFFYINMLNGHAHVSCLLQYLMHDGIIQMRLWTLCFCCLPCLTSCIFKSKKHFVWMAPYGFGTTWRWVNDDKILIFEWTVPLRCHCSYEMLLTRFVFAAWLYIPTSCLFPLDLLCLSLPFPRVPTFVSQDFQLFINMRLKWTVIREMMTFQDVSWLVSGGALLRLAAGRISLARSVLTGVASP